VLALGLTSALLLIPFGLLVGAGTRPSHRLPEAVRHELASIPTRRRAQHVVDLELVDGRVVEKVYVAHGKYIALIGGRMRSHRFTASDVAHATNHLDGQPR
jgi:hypothetical protein